MARGKKSTSGMSKKDLQTKSRAKQSSKPAKDKGKKLSSAQLGVGVLGMGTVALGVAEILSRHAELIEARTGVRLKLVRALVRNTRRKRAGAGADVPLTQDPEAIVSADDVQIVVELLGGIEPAYSWIRTALENGKSVVTANKAVIAARGIELDRCAKKHGVDLYYEAAVGGGIPIIRTLREGLASDRITSVTGVLNGTSNFILDRIDQGLGYPESLAIAQDEGYAEADPFLDVSGGDAADKLAILARLAFGVKIKPKQIDTEGITHLTPAMFEDARSLGYRIKLVGIAQRVAVSPTAKNKAKTKTKTKARALQTHALDVRVHTVWLPANRPLAAVPGAQNAIQIQSDALGPSLYQGAGAGGMPTGSAVVSDLIDVARNLRSGASRRVAEMGGRTEDATLPLLPSAEAVCGAYMTLDVRDAPGVLASITHIFAKEDVSLKTVLQQGNKSDDDSAGAKLVLLVHPAPFGAIQRSVARLRRLASVRALACIRIEDQL